MPADSPWDSTRWRDASQTPRYEGVLQHPPLAAGQPSHAGAQDSYAHTSWCGSAHGGNQHYDYDSRRSSQTYSGTWSQHAQPEPHHPRGSYGPPTPLNSSKATGSYAASGQSSKSLENVARDGRDAPLSLHIPNQNQELPSLAHGYTTPRSDAPVYSSGTNSWLQRTTSLPSFAALSEQAVRNDEPDEVEIAPMSARLSCAQCTKLGPLIREVAKGLIELDSNIQNLCSTSASRSAEVPNDSAMRTVHWILDRMRYTNRDVQDVARHAAGDRRPSPLPSSLQLNPPKRSADQWDQDEMPPLKLPRPSPSQGDAASGERGNSVDFATRDPIQRSAFSPAPSDSAPGSAYPRHGSPNPGRPPRALPSPSSLAFPPSATASFVPGNAASVGSPSTSYHPGSSIHTVSTNSATSAHLQDLQHQVSLKSLALQTLQTEYATLLQKLQRERIKSQTIEKKTTVADQEVNDLTTRNEELQEQIKTLEVQLQECEQKRESERTEAARDKEQWGRMLDMSGRLQSKNAHDRQRLANEKADLLQRLAAYEQNGSVRGDHAGRSPGADSAVRSQHTSVSTMTREDGTTHASSSPLSFSGDIKALRSENAALQARAASLRTALEEVQHRYISVEDSIVQLASHKDLLRRVLDQAISGERSDAETEGRDPMRSHDTLLPQPKPSFAPGLSTAPMPSISITSSPSNPPVSSAASAIVKHASTRRLDPFSPENLAQIARAHSPGPAELGFHVQPSTSSPEELIKALGPVPAPLPSIRFPPSSSAESYPLAAESSSRGRRQSQPFIAPLSLPPGGEGAPSFRPLTHPPASRATQATQYAGSSPHSHHSSPGPNRSNASSPGTTSTHSPEHGIGGGEHNLGRRHSQPQLQFTISPSTAAMPPPPRPFP